MTQACSRRSGEWRKMESGGGGGVESGRKEKGERMKVTSPSLPTPTTSLSFPVLILLGP